MPDCGAYERIALQNSRCLYPLLATASLVERVALPEKDSTIGPFFVLVLRNTVSYHSSDSPIHCRSPSLSVMRDSTVRQRSS
jgi:hypothetical protein